MQKKAKYAIAVLCVVITALIATVAAVLYPNGKLIFSGITMVYNSININGNNTQGFVDLTLRNINTTGVSFCIYYDKNYLELSNVIDNEPIKNPTTGYHKLNTSHEFFKEGTDLPPDCFKNSSQIAMPGGSIIGAADADNGYLLMNFIPKEESVGQNQYIQKVKIDDRSEQPAIMANTQKGVSLGSISFNIKDPDVFAKLTPTQMKDVIHVEEFSKLTKIDDPSHKNKIAISYIDEAYNLKYLEDSAQHIGYEFNIKPIIKDVKLPVNEFTVSAFDIYKNGTVSDLIDFLNDKASLIKIFYTDESEIPGIMNWNATDSNASTITWNAKGGDFTLKQKFNDIMLEATVHVTPVELTGYQVDNESITYLDGAPGFPTTFDELNLAKTARPILSPFIPNGGLPDLIIDWYDVNTNPGSSINTLPAGFGGGPGTFIFTGHLLPNMENTLQTDNPWLTINSPPLPQMTRIVVTDPADMPKELKVISAVTDDSGVLTLVLENSDGPTIPSGTTFKIKLPNGSVLDTSALGIGYNPTITGGQATIVINPDRTLSADDYNKMVAKILNLGERAGDFWISSTEPGKTPGPEIKFKPNARKNSYLEQQYSFDYSTNKAAMFPMKTSQVIPTTVTLLDPFDDITITYDGFDGSEPGKLRTFTVDSWTAISGNVTASGNSLQITGTAGDIIEIEGELSDTTYTNHGPVQNTLTPKSKVVIKFVVSDDDGTESIDLIPDFVFNTQQEGYDLGQIQTQTFTIRNSGLVDIQGLSATISLSQANNTEAFVLKKSPLPILNKGSTTTFDISTKGGLPAGTYKSTVTISSNKGVLQTFTVTFEVSTDPVYNIELTSNDSNLGSAATQSGLYTEFVGNTVTIVASPEPDCRFVRWDVKSPTSATLNLASSTSATTSFTMPAQDVKIEAVFEETLAAKLRLTDLLVKDNQMATCQLNDATWAAVTFNPATREYYVTVPNTSDTAQVWFKPRQEAITAGAQITVTHTAVSSPNPSASPAPSSSPTPTTVPYTTDSLDPLLKKTGDIPIELSPMDNLVTISMTATDTSTTPSTQVTREYKIHIFRKLTQSEMVEFQYGNSPHGMIKRDPTLSQNSSTSLTQFISDNYAFKGSNVPAGATANIEYSPKSWDTVNYDLDEYALFVINDQTFTDPGIVSLTNSIGKPVTTYTKSVEVNVMDTPAGTGDGSTTDFALITPTTIPLPNTGTISDLNTKRIRPDIYFIKYEFTDYDGSTANVTKPLIVLAPIGDYNVSGSAEDRDVQRNLNRFSSKLPDNMTVVDYGTGGKVYKYRVCDVNKDGNVNAIDANNIRIKPTIPLVEFYNNM